MKTFTARTLIFISTGILLFLGAFFHFPFHYPSFAPLPVSASALSELSKDTSLLPTRLRIPKINLDAAVEYVGLTSKGTVGVPSGPSTVAWYNLGPRPGEAGSSVIDGHSGYKNKKPAVFDNLYKLKKGDKIYIENQQGTIDIFVVREFKSYRPSDYAPEVFYSNDGKAHLNLITCDGVWNPIAKTHSNRLVVFTDKE